MLNLTNTAPWDDEPPVEIPGWGQLSGNIIDDAVTRSRYAWQNGGAVYALANYGAQLREMIDQKTWRSQDAFDMLAFLRRQVLSGTITHHTEPIKTFVEATSVP